MEVKGVPEGGGPLGLSGEEARRRLREYGPNAIPEERAHPILALFERFWGPVAWMLEATIAIELYLRRFDEAVIIALLLILNAVVSVIEEGRAKGALALLKRRLQVTARACRDGKWQTVPAESLVPGDRVHLRMGDLAPADITLLDGEVLLDQSALTGESFPVEAQAGALAYAGSVIERGEATGEVAATGTHTYFGKTAELVRTAKAPSRLGILVFSIVKALVALDCVLVALLLVYAALAGMPYVEVLPFALILLVASVPIALPVTFTVATALGASELARQGVLVTHLAAIEEAAGMDILLTDKTGTITENRLALSSLYPLPPRDENALLHLAALASDPATEDPFDKVILEAETARGLADTHGLRRLSFLPFDPARRYSKGVYEEAEGPLAVIKGAPEAVAALCREPPDLAAAIADLASRGNRVLAVASGKEGELRLAGVLGFEDPPRPDSKSLVQGLNQLGVRVVMVTGDNLVTARAVAASVGIEGRAAAPEEIDSGKGGAALDAGVFARAFPEHKFRLAEIFQKEGHIVGMTGDGVNDAPALKKADVGIAVAGATDVARAAAGVVLTRAGLVNALSAVENSRRIYQRMLTYTLNKIAKTLEIALFLTVGVIAAKAFVITPLLIVLLLFTNDFVTMAIATDRVAFSLRPDRWSVKNLMIAGGSLAALILLFSFTVFFVGHDALKLPLKELQTVIFVMLVLTGQGTLYLVRERRHFWQSQPSRFLLLSSLADIAVVFFLASRGILMAAVSPGLLGLLLAAALVYLFFVDQLKVALFRRFQIR